MISVPVPSMMIKVQFVIALASFESPFTVQLRAAWHSRVSVKGADSLDELIGEQAVAGGNGAVDAAMKKV